MMIKLRSDEFELWRASYMAFIEEYTKYDKWNGIEHKQAAEAADKSILEYRKRNNRGGVIMKGKEHKERHIKLHEYFDELLADFIYHRNILPSKTTILELMQWSHKQTTEPTEIPEDTDVNEKE